MEDPVAEMQAEFPEWRIGTVTTTANSGPDRRNFTARRDGVLLAAPDAPSLREKIRREEAR